MLEFKDQKEEIQLDINEIKLFQNLLRNFKDKINTVKTNFDSLSNSK